MEACESGSIFQGLLSESLNIYATTASNARESSWGTYCPGMAPAPPEEFNTCLGDLYSVAFLENRCANAFFFFTRSRDSCLATFRVLSLSLLKVVSELGPWRELEFGSGLEEGKGIAVSPAQSGRGFTATSRAAAYGYIAHQHLRLGQ